jgi:hypothetical protein
MERDSTTTRLPLLRQGRKAEVLAVNWVVADFGGATLCMYGTTWVPLVDTMSNREIQL